jgi:hypothetical protein
MSRFMPMEGIVIEQAGDRQDEKYNKGNPYFHCFTAPLE